MPREAFLHIGLPKTGTSYVQRTLRTNAATLTRAGTLVLPEPQAMTRNAVWDLLGRRVAGSDADIAGAWPSLAERVERSPCERVVLSEEYLVHAKPRHVRAIRQAFATRELHVVVTVRDLGRAMRSMWQQNTQKGRTVAWPDYVRSVRDPRDGPPTSGVAFWLRYDLERVLNVWASGGGQRQHTHVVIVPKANSPPTVLFERFAEATGIERRGLRIPDEPVLVSPDPLATELLRRLNVRLASGLTEHQYMHVMRQTVRPELGHRAERRPIAFPDEHRQWASEQSERLIAYLRQQPIHIVGDCDDLLPRFDDDMAPHTGDLTDADMASVAIDLLACVLERQARGPSRSSPKDVAVAADPNARTRVESWVRSLGFRTRRRALETADRSPWAARAANTYLRRWRRTR
jgi:hypothetical protein